MCAICDCNALIGRYVKDIEDPGMNLPAEGLVIGVAEEEVPGRLGHHPRIVVETYQDGMPPFAVTRDPMDVELITVH